MLWGERLVASPPVRLPPIGRSDTTFGCCNRINMCPNVGEFYTRGAASDRHLGPWLSNPAGGLK